MALLKNVQNTKSYLKIITLKLFLLKSDKNSFVHKLLSTTPAPYKQEKIHIEVTYGI